MVATVYFNTMADIKFPPLTEPYKDFCHFKREDWYKSSPPLDKDGLNILLIRPSSMGDVLLLTPVINSIKQKFPNTNIDVMTLFPRLFLNNPNIRKCIGLDPMLKCSIEYDRIYFMSYEFTPQIHIAEAYANIVGIQLENKEPSLYLTEKEICNAKEMIKRMTSMEKFIILHKECNWKTRCWNERYWEELAFDLKHTYRDSTVISISQSASGRVKNTFGAVNLDIRLVMGILYLSEFIVCIDSGIMHLGVALGKPVFSIFTITDPDKRLPDKWLKLAVQSPTEFAGCHHKSTPPVELEPQLSRLTINDMQDKITPKIIMNTIYSAGL